MQSRERHQHDLFDVKPDHKQQRCRCVSRADKQSTISWTYLRELTRANSGIRKPVIKARLCGRLEPEVIRELKPGFAQASLEVSDPFRLNSPTLNGRGDASYVVPHAKELASDGHLSISIYLLGTICIVLDQLC